MTTRQIENRIRKIKSLEAEKKVAEEQIAKLQNELKDEMKIQNTTELTGTTGSARWIQFVTRRFDSKAFRADNEALYKAYIRTAPSQRFTIA